MTEGEIVNMMTTHWIKDLILVALIFTMMLYAGVFLGYAVYRLIDLSAV